MSALPAVRAVAAACVLAVLAACGSREEAAREAAGAAQQAAEDAKQDLANGSIHLDPLSFTSEGVRISRSGGPDALVAADGTFKIDGQAIATTPEQRAQFVKYYESATSMRTHAIETGLAGAEVAKTAVGEVFSGLLKGDTSQIQAKVEQSAENVKQAASRLCGDLEAIAGVEASLAASLEAFAPYRFVETSKIDNCRSETAPAAAAAAPAAPVAPVAPAAPVAPVAPANAPAATP